MTWKSFYRKKPKDKFQEKAKEFVKERDANFRENWQQWQDEKESD